MSPPIGIMSPMDPRLASRYRACLLGGAIGDALGAPVEFLDLREIHRKYGPGGIRDYANAFGRLGAITDDTQMTLFTAEGLLDGKPTPVAATALAYLRWLHTQGARPPAGAGVDHLLASGWLIGHRELFSRRGPGVTCLTALERMDVLGQPAVNTSKGCGGVMRMAPVGLLVPDRRHAFELGATLGGLTHGHPTGQLAAGAFALIVRCLLEGATLPVAMAAAQAELRGVPDFEETFNAIAGAARMAASDTPHDVAIRELGEGWIAEEALAIALYCGLVAETFEEGVILAVNHGGDSDSTGSIAGNLLGLIHGEAAIPARWLEPLELREVIATMAERLAGG